ncbi:MAG: glycosyltransferase [Blastocatellia bacterium]
MNALVSVIIPCHNQAHFLHKAIESVLRQTWERVEIIVIDDGSTDHTAEIAARYPSVRYVYQTNQERCAARNHGVSVCQGEYLLFLDADDLLTPDAIASCMACYAQNPGSGFVYGRYELITADGSPMLLPPRRELDYVNYRAFLQHNCVGMLGAVVFRRDIYEAVGGFDRDLYACEDYELFLRIARAYPVTRHDGLCASYRQHEMNTTRDATRMLITAIGVLRRQEPFVTGSIELETALQKGNVFLRHMYGNRMIAEVERDISSLKTLKHGLAGLGRLLRYYPDGLLAGAMRRSTRLLGGVLTPRPTPRSDSPSFPAAKPSAR